MDTCNGMENSLDTLSSVNVEALMKKVRRATKEAERATTMINEYLARRNFGEVIYLEGYR